MPRFARDLTLIVRELEADKPVLVGHSMGCQVILEFASQNPGMARGLVPMLGTYARPLDTLMDSPYSRRLFEVVHRLALAGGRTGRRWFRPLVGAPWALDLATRSGLVDRHYANRQDLEMYLEHLNHIDPRVLFRTVALMAEHDLTDRLPSITTPTLVVAAENDLFTPVHRARRMSELLPDAELFVLAGGSHAAIVEQPETIYRRMDRWLVEKLGDPPA
jgi:pimeloyl-ACP methyl ester carboxylesterase